MTRNHVLFLVFAIFILTACTGPEAEFQISREKEATVPIENAIEESTEPKSAGVVPKSVVPTQTPPAVSQGTEPTPVNTGSDTTVFMYQDRDNEVNEGDSFVVRIDFDGPAPQEGYCVVHTSDTSNTETGVVSQELYTDGESIAVRVDTDNDGKETRGRSVTISIVSCSFPDLDRAGTTYSIDSDRSRFRVWILENGEIAPSAANGTFTATPSNLRVEDGQIKFTVTIDPEPPYAVSFEVKYHNTFLGTSEDIVPLEGTDWGTLYEYTPRGWYYWNRYFDINPRVVGSTHEIVIWDTSRWDLDPAPREIRVELVEMYKSRMICQKVYDLEYCPEGYDGLYYTPPGGTYEVGDPNELTITVNPDD